MNTNNTRTPQILPRPVGAKFFFILLVGFTAFMSSCNESSVVGLDVQPGSDLINVGYEDTTTIATRTMREDSLHTDASILVPGDVLMGQYWDPTFGVSTASLYTQLRLPSNAPTFGVNPICDSVVLTMVYNPTYYGKKGRAIQTVNVYPLSQVLSASSDYYSNNELSYIPNDLAQGHRFMPAPGISDSVVVWGVKLKPQLRIPLQNNFGTAILNSQGTSVLATNTAFQNYFKGFYITTENTDFFGNGEIQMGNIMSYKLGDALSKVTIFYHNNTADSLKYDLPLSSVPRFSKFTHNYSSAAADPDLASQIGSTPAAQSPKVYVQAMAGTKVKIDFPYIEHWKDAGPIAINKAELVIKVDQESTYLLDTFAAPAKFLLFAIKSDGTMYGMPDDVPANGGIELNQTFDGTYNSTTKEYHFNIARYIQQVITGTRENNGLYLRASNGAVNAARVVIGGGNAPAATKMKLNLTYTKIH